MSPTVSVLELAAAAAFVTVTWGGAAVEALSSKTIVSAATLAAPRRAAPVIAVASAAREFLKTCMAVSPFEYVVVTVSRPAASKPKLRSA